MWHQKKYNGGIFLRKRNVRKGYQGGAIILYCKRCVYPANTRPYIILDSQGVCSGCRVHETRLEIDWEERERWLKELLSEYKDKSKDKPYDCIIPVSGGKDSHYQTYLMTQKYGMRPLLVCYNHGFNTHLGNRNLANLIKQFPCGLVRYTSSVETVRKISIYMLKKCGDITWHYHAGINTFPIQTAVRYKIPLIIWGEHGFADLMGMFNQNDMVEFTKKVRREHSMRGFDALDLVGNDGITLQDVEPFMYPSNEELEALDVRGIYLSNYIHWDARKQTKLMIKKYGFETALWRERTFHLYDKLDDIHANGTHDYLKYLKFGYGRATDDASMEIRHRRMTREEGIELVGELDHIRPHDLDIFLKFTGMTEAEFEDTIETMRDKNIWSKVNGKWVVQDSVTRHVKDVGVDDVRLPLVEDRVSLKPSPNARYEQQTDYEWI